MVQHGTQLISAFKRKEITLSWQEKKCRSLLIREELLLLEAIRRSILTLDSSLNILKMIIQHLYSAGMNLCRGIIYRLVGMSDYKWLCKN